MEEPQQQPAERAAEKSGQADNAEERKPSFWKRRPVIIVGTVVLGGLFFLGLDYLAESFTHESTDDAFLSANTVSIAPQVAGRIKRVLVNDNAPVKAGDLLAEIDPKDFEIEIAQKEAAKAAADANVKLLLASIEMLRTEVNTAQATAKQSEAEVAADKAAADKAQADLNRAEDLIQKKIISPQEYDAAKAAAAAAKANLDAAQEKVASDRSKVAQSQAQLEAGRRAWDRAQAQAKQTTVDVQQSEQNFTYTRITAPQAGHVTRKAVEVGDYVQAGQRLMAIVPSELWVIANFKETQLKNIRTNQPVKIRVDSVGGRVFAGHVQSIQAGSGAAFSLLPPENAVGNFVKVVQRVPVKIVFDKPIEAEHVLGPGLSVAPSVKVRNYEIPDFAVAIAAAILALVVGYLWARAAGKTSES